MTRRKELLDATLVGFLAVMTALLLASGVAGADDESRPAAEAVSLETPRQDLPEPVLDSLRAALGAYEDVRSELAADQLEGVSAIALRLVGGLRLALARGGELGGELLALIEEAAVVAESLGEAENLETARGVFSEVSRLMVLLVGGEPQLVEGLQVFACPMVDTFNKWIQPTEELENPYMGAAMPKCGFASDWSAPATPASEETRTAAREPEALAPIEAFGPEPEFKPGIPGLEMVDVRDYRFLWSEIAQLQTWERGDRISVAEYRSKAIEKTVRFLELRGPAADRFSAAASQAVASVRESFHERRQVGDEPGLGTEFSSDLRAATTRLTSVLEGEPRHQLFAPECKKWILRLAFSPTEAKEHAEG